MQNGPGYVCLKIWSDLFIFSGDLNEDGYDTSNSFESEEDFEEDDEDVFSGKVSSTKKKKEKKENTEHYNPNSLSWLVMRLAIIKLAQHQLQTFINIAGIEMQGTFPS